MHGIKIRVIDDVERFTRNMDDAARRQVPFAIARALTWTAKDAQGDVQADLPKRFTLRNNWVKNGIRITPATKASPQAVVGSLEPFMERQETGGAKRSRGGHRVAVPKTKPTRIIPRAQRPSAIRNKPRVFTIKTASGAGIVRRQGKARYPLQLLYWLKRGVQVKPAFGFKGTTGTTVRDRFGPNFIESLSQAMGHRG
jgi:hypothetical protein